MARSVTPKANRTIWYYNAAGRIYPAIVTGVVSGTTINLRVGHVLTVPSVVLGNRNPFSVRTSCWMVR